MDKGGQNPIEPAAYAKPVLFGEYMYNFASEAESLISRGGGFLVNNAYQMAQLLDKLISNPSFRVETGQKALEAVKAQRGAVSKNLNFIKEILN